MLTQRTASTQSSETAREEFIPSFPHRFDRTPSVDTLGTPEDTSTDPRLKRTSAHAHPGAVLAKASEHPEFFSTIADEPLPNTVTVPIAVPVRASQSFLDMDSPYSSPAASTHRSPSVLSLHQVIIQDGMSSDTSSPQSTLRRKTAYRNINVPTRPALRDSTFSVSSGISTTPSSPPHVEVQLEEHLSPSRPNLRARAASTSQVEAASRNSQIINDHRRMHSDPSTALPSDSSDVELQPSTVQERPGSSLLGVRAPRLDTISLPSSSDRGSIIAPSVASHARSHSVVSTWGTVTSNGAESTVSSLSGVQLIGFHNHHQRHSTQLSIRTDSSGFRDSIDAPMPLMTSSFLGLGDHE